MIYLDNAATAQPCDRAVRECERMIREDYFNPSALYLSGVKVKNQVENARTVLALKLNCLPKEIYFTSGATEANNWAVLCGFKNKSGNIVITAGEHPSVYETAAYHKNRGCDVRVAPLKPDGTVDAEGLLSLIDEKTALVSVINVSNETGAVNDIASISRAVREKNANCMIHSDGVQAFGKIPVDLKADNLDLYSVSAHKIGGLKGIGALYIREGRNIAPLLYGGGQEHKMRSGTENTVGIVSFAVAIESLPQFGRVFNLYDCAVKKLEALGNVKINGGRESGSGYIISAGIEGIKAEILQHMCYDAGVMIGLGSACSSKSNRNRTLESMKVKKEFIQGNIRISFGFNTTLEEVGLAMDIITEKTKKLRGMIHG